MKNRSAIFTMLLLFLLLSAQSAVAAITTYNFSGTITGITGGPTGESVIGVDIGNPFSGILNINPQDWNASNWGNPEPFPTTYFPNEGPSYLTLGGNTFDFVDGTYYKSSDGLFPFSLNTMNCDTENILSNKYNFNLSEVGVNIYGFSSGNLYLYGNGTDYELIGAIDRVSPVPVPSTLLLLGSGLTAMTGFIRKRRVH